MSRNVPASTVLVRLREIREKREVLAAEIRKSSPHFGALKYPQPVDLAGALPALDSGTVLLSYSVGKDRTLLFAVAPAAALAGASRLEVFPIAIRAEVLRDRVNEFRRLALAGAGPGSTRELKVVGRELFDLLVAPAAVAIAASARVLIVPDGLLHVLPFSALVRDGGAAEPQYLVEWKPLHTVASVTLYSEQDGRRGAGRTASPVLLAAFGDPRYRVTERPVAVAMRGGEDEPVHETPDVCPDEIEDATLRSAVAGGFNFRPLPDSRREVESIAGIYAPGVRVYLGPEATEERAKSLGNDVRIVHFACHAQLNHRFPLDSALALTTPEHAAEGGENGLLQAWEIFERVRLDADLVTLSACESGLGKEVGGEGLLGLTRAFQYAGARSVLASLWKVEDEATFELMSRFYGHLHAGVAKDEALRQAQIEMIRTSRTASGLDLSEPRRWASFELTGDWQ